MLVSNEVDLYPLHAPALADVIEGALGRDSPFHRQFHYYADSVGPETATLPDGWQRRAYKLKNDNTGGATAVCPEIHDIAAAKMLAGREKDLQWVQAGVDAGLSTGSCFKSGLRIPMPTKPQSKSHFNACRRCTGNSGQRAGADDRPSRCILRCAPEVA